jgi:NDP-4-keto-2,6-dideoxyhexose 3-C-methyltransferase
MRQHLKALSEYARSFFQDRPLNVLDIGSNDGTLLSFFAPACAHMVGVDPCSSLYAKNYPQGARVISDFFSKDVLDAQGVTQSFDIVTSIAMFYDLHDPIKFAQDIRSVLAPDGIWITEQTTSQTLIEQLAYDSICHEHLTYLSVADMELICERSGLKLIDLTSNDSNGSSLRFVMARSESSRSPKYDNIARAKAAQSAFDLKNASVWRKFREDVEAHRKKLSEIVQGYAKRGKVVLGFGASTKGNVILQYCGIDSKTMPAIVDRDPNKVGLETPGTRIPIVSEEAAAALAPDIYVVFPWHFRDEIVRREAKFLEAGGGLLFILPRMELVTREGAIRL